MRCCQITRCCRWLWSDSGGRWSRQAGGVDRRAADDCDGDLWYIRMMVLKARYGWGYRTLVARVSDSSHLRRFCLIGLSKRARRDRGKCWSARSARHADWPRSPGARRGEVALPRNGRRLRISRNWRIAARRSPDRSASESRASRSSTGPCRGTTGTPGRFVRASSERRRNLGSSHSWRRYIAGLDRLGNRLRRRCYRHGRRARPARDQDPRGRRGRRVQARTDGHCARVPSLRDGVHRWPPGSGPQAHHPPAAALPPRRGGPDQPPQTLPRSGALPPKRRPEPSDLE